MATFSANDSGNPSVDWRFTVLKPMGNVVDYLYVSWWNNGNVDESLSVKMSDFREKLEEAFPQYHFESTLYVIDNRDVVVKEISATSACKIEFNLESFKFEDATYPEETHTLVIVADREDERIRIDYSDIL